MLKDFLCIHGDYHDDKTFRDLTTIKMGGEIAHYIEPYNIDDLKIIINYLKTNRIPFKVIGNGSNLICGTSRYEGVVISLKHFDNYEITNNCIYAEAGILVPYLVSVMLNNNLKGLEFASGIPGSVGGLVYMNAGAYRKEMADVIKSVIVLKDDEIVTMNKDELKFAYRYSIFQEHPHWLIIAANFELEYGDKEETKAIIADRAERRRTSQPTDKLSAGSCFRNPDNEFAWKLIDGIGYRGKNINGVEVSNKHSNFIINVDNGKGEDYLKLALDIQKKVKEKYNIKLIMEVEKFNC